MSPSPVFDALVLTQLGHQLGDPGALHHFVDRYLAMLDRRVERMGHALMTKDFDGWLDAALSLGSASAMLGAVALAGIAREAYAGLVARTPVSERWPDERDAQNFMCCLRQTAAETERQLRDYTPAELVRA